MQPRKKEIHFFSYLRTKIQSVSFKTAAKIFFFCMRGEKMKKNFLKKERRNDAWRCEEYE
jgi:hypothetical protein